jgi:hypothetical protein
MGIKRWPQRKLRALNDCLRKLGQLTQTPENIRSVACIEEQRAALYQQPSSIYKVECSTVECAQTEATEAATNLVTEVDAHTPALKANIPSLKLDLNAILQILNQRTEPIIQIRPEIMK